MTMAFRCDDLDTPHGYIPTKNISEPDLAPKRDILSQNLPFWGPEGCQDQAKVFGNHVFNSGGAAGGS